MVEDRSDEDLLQGHAPVDTGNKQNKRCKVCYKDADNKSMTKRSSTKCKKCSELLGYEDVLCIKPCFEKLS